MLPEIKIIDMRKAPSLVPERLGKLDVHFTYMIGAEGPFMISVPAEDLQGKTFEEQKHIVRSMVEKEHAERLRWKGTTI